jgi:glutamine synthetase
MICNIQDPLTKPGLYPRSAQHRPQGREHMKASGIADMAPTSAPSWSSSSSTAIRYDQNQHEGYYYIDSAEGIWNSGREDDNGGAEPRQQDPLQGRLFPRPPSDTLQDIRTE